MTKILNNQLYNDDLARVVNKYKFSDLKDSRILITGGVGLVGSSIVDVLYTCNKLLNLNIKIFIATREECEFDERYKDIDNIYFVKYDAMKPILFNIDLDFIISCAGIANPKLYVTAPVETLLTSFDGTKNLLEYCQQHSVKRFLFVSSSEIYGVKSEDKSYDEKMYGYTDMDNIRTSYAIGKISSELLCRSYSSEYLVDSVIARPGHIFGPTASRYDQKVSSEFAYLAAMGKELVLKSSGMQKRSYCYCLDCAVAILTILLKGKTGEAYNVGHSEITSIRQMSEYMAEAGGVELNVADPTEQELKEFNPMNNSALSIEKIKSLGYEDSFGVKEACKHTIQILKQVLYSND